MTSSCLVNLVSVFCGRGIWRALPGLSSHQSDRHTQHALLAGELNIHCNGDDNDNGNDVTC